jgi:hypothetical protein
MRSSLAHDSTGNAIGRFDGMYVDDREFPSKAERIGDPANTAISSAMRHRAHATSTAMYLHLGVPCGSVSLTAYRHVKRF